MAMLDSIVVCDKKRDKEERWIADAERHSKRLRLE